MQSIGSDSEGDLSTTGNSGKTFLFHCYVSKLKTMILETHNCNISRFMYFFIVFYKITEFSYSPRFMGQYTDLSV